MKITKSQLRKLRGWWTWAWDLADPDGGRIFVFLIFGCIFVPVYLSFVFTDFSWFLLFPVGLVAYFLACWLFIGFVTLCVYLVSAGIAASKRWYENLEEGSEKEKSKRTFPALSDKPNAQVVIIDEATERARKKPS